jgi:uroporphyrin-III C-methyltransferase
VGAGPGDPGLLTRRGLELLRAADVVVYDRLVNPSLLDEAPPRALRLFAGKPSGAAHPEADEQARINALLVEQARRGRRVVRLKGGDPFVFGRGGEEAEALAAAGIPFQVVPGVSSAVAAPAYAGIPLTHRRLSSSLAVVTGHEADGRAAPAVHWRALATGVDTLVVLMGVRALPGDRCPAPWRTVGRPGRRWPWCAGARPTRRRPSWGPWPTSSRAPGWRRSPLRRWR